MSHEAEVNNFDEGIFWETILPAVQEYSRRFFLNDPAISDDDLAQSAALKLLCYTRKYDELNVPPSVAIKRTVKSMHTDMLRKRYAQAQHEPWGFELDSQPDHWYHTEAQSSHTIKILGTILSKNALEVVFMNFFCGFTHAEISERTGLPLGTVKARIKRARDRLRDSFENPQEFADAIGMDY